MADIYYETNLYSDDEIKDKYISEVKGKDSRVIDKGFIDHILNRSSLTVKKKCYMTVSLTCDKDITVHYSAHKKVEETTGYTVTKRTDAMGIDDYKVSENTKKVTYTDSGDYSKSFYNVSESVTICVDDNFSFNAELPKGSGETRVMPAVYRSVTPYTGISTEMIDRLTSSSGCYSEISKCRGDIDESAKRTGYTVDSCTLKKATVSDINVKSVRFYVQYTVSVMYNGKPYMCELYHSEFDGVLEISGDLTFPKSKDLEKRYKDAVSQGKKNKNKGKALTAPAITIGIIGIIMSFVLAFKVGFSNGFPFVIATLVFNIWYIGWATTKPFEEINLELDLIKIQYTAGEYIDSVRMPKIEMLPLIISSILITLFNMIFILITLFPELY